MAKKMEGENRLDREKQEWKVTLPEYSKVRRVADRNGTVGCV